MVQLVVHYLFGDSLGTLEGTLESLKIDLGTRRNCATFLVGQI